MPCPFPGMDPYIENPEIWGDFQHCFTVSMRAALQSVLRPNYVAMTARRLVILPDRNEKAQRLLVHIVEPDAIDRPITIIDLLSHTDRIFGIGAPAESPKRTALLESGTNLVEIDLLRRDWRKPQVRADGLENADTWHYEVSVSRCSPRQLHGYVVRLRTPLPIIAIPLAHGLSDVSLNLQAVFERNYDEGPYSVILRYAGPPPGPMSPADAAWCHEIWQKAGLAGSSAK